MAEEDYYKALKEENYTTLLDKEIQLDNARQRALKNTQTTMSGLGMGSSGYASSAQNGIESAYLAGLENAQKTYQEQTNDINMQQIQDQQTQNENNYNSMLQVLTNSTDSTSMNQALKSYGITYDPTTKSMSGAGWDKLTDSQKNDLLASINLKQYGYDQEIAQADIAGRVADISDGKSIITYKNDSQVEVLSGWFDSERRTLLAGMATGQFKNGDVIKLQNWHNSTAYFTYQDGQLLYIDKSTYNKASKDNQYYIYGTGSLQKAKK